MNFIIQILMVRKIVSILKRGGLCVLPTETIYGIVADATNNRAVCRLYKIRRPSGRPFILLLPNHLWLDKLHLIYNKSIINVIYRIEGLTLVLEKKDAVPLFLTKGRKDIAIRIPKKGLIKRILLELGKPVVAPSANPEGRKPAHTIEEAIKYFGDKVDLYVDGGTLKGKPSTIIKINGKKVKLLREGVVRRDFLKKSLLLFGFEPLF